MLKQKEIREQVAARLNNASPKPLKAILFGSYAYGKPGEYSDVDLVVVLDKDGKSDSYRTLINNRREISKMLRDLKKKYRIDILVYTRDEWEELRASGSSFIRKIEDDGVAIL